MEILETYLPLILGAFICLFGYRLKKAVFFVAWFLIGFTITSKALPLLTGSLPEIVNSDFWQHLLPVAGGLLLSLIGFSIEKVCVSLLAFFAIIALAVSYYGVDIQVIVIAAIIGVVVAGFATMLIKPSVIIVTAIIGSLVVSQFILSIAQNMPAETYQWPLLAAVALVSSVFQFATCRNID